MKGMRLSLPYSDKSISFLSPLQTTPLIPTSLFGGVFLDSISFPLAASINLQRKGSIAAAPVKESSVLLTRCHTNGVCAGQGRIKQSNLGVTSSICSFFIIENLIEIKLLLKGALYVSQNVLPPLLL